MTKKKQTPELTPEQIAALPWINRAIIKLAAMITPDPATVEYRKGIDKIRRASGSSRTNHIYRNMPFK
jgi:hypothetical protein